MNELEENLKSLIVSFIEFPLYSLRQYSIIACNKEFNNITNKIIKNQKEERLKAYEDAKKILDLIYIKYEDECNTFCDIFEIEDENDTDLIKILYDKFLVDVEIVFNPLNNLPLYLFQEMEYEIEEKTNNKSKYFYDKLYQEILNIIVLSESRKFDSFEIFQQNKVILHIIKILEKNGYNIYMEETEDVLTYNEVIKSILKLKNIFTFQ